MRTENKMVVPSRDVRAPQVFKRMTRPKPKDWEPRGIELWEEVSKLYSEEQLRTIVAIIGEFKGKRHKEVAGKILGVACWLNSSLHYGQRPTPPQVKAALKQTASCLAGLRDALAKLDSDSRNAVMEAAGRAPLDHQTERPAWPSSFLCQTRFDRVEKQLQNLDLWIKTAVSEQKPGRKGRKPHDHAKEAAFRLLSVWKEYLRKPSLDPFIDLLREATRPVYEKNGMKQPDLESAARAVLYDGWHPPCWIK
jgi:hypothetical protein